MPDLFPESISGANLPGSKPMVLLATTDPDCCWPCWFCFVLRDRLPFVLSVAVCRRFYSPPSKGSSAGCWSIPSDDE